MNSSFYFNATYSRLNLQRKIRLKIEDRHTPVEFRPKVWDETVKRIKEELTLHTGINLRIFKWENYPYKVKVRSQIHI